MTLSRRGLITGLVSLVAAPAIVRVASLMPVKVMEPTWQTFHLDIGWGVMPVRWISYEEALERWPDPAAFSQVAAREGIGYPHFIFTPGETHVFDGRIS